MKLLDQPFAVVCGLIAGVLSRRIARALWRLVDEEAPPSPTTERAPLSKVLGAAAIEGLAFSVTRAAVDRAGARGFAHMFGVWPGDRGRGDGESPEA